MTKRPSLQTFAPKAAPEQPASSNVVPLAQDDAAPRSTAKYPKINVYLEADELRTIKLIALNEGRRISDVCATAIREWLDRNGHKRSKKA